MFVDVGPFLDRKLALVRGFDGFDLENVNPEVARATARYWGRFAGPEEVEPLEILKGLDVGFRAHLAYVGERTDALVRHERGECISVEVRGGDDLHAWVLDHRGDHLACGTAESGDPYPYRFGVSQCGEVLVGWA